ncbi:MAG TPA: glycoside hydrolase family 44 protein [Anaeromyxobacteraceae bacterium]|nr:glycoside hydrolase family 44 protein [Anaeromyxobacteraceae bacterium]
MDPRARERGRKGALGRLGLPALLLAASIPAARAADRPPGKRQPAEAVAAEVVYQGRLKPGWRDDGWAPRLVNDGPARLDMSGQGGWMLSNPSLKGKFGGFSFRFQAPPRLGDFLEVRLDAEGGEVFPKVEVTPADRVDLPGGWCEVFIPLSRLDPSGAPFDSVVIRAGRPIEATPVFLDDIAFTHVAAQAPPPAEPPAPAPAAKGTAKKAAPAAAATAAAARPAAPALAPPPPPLPPPQRNYGPSLATKVAIECAGPTHRISPQIYGIAYDQRLDASESHQFELGATARRWGGNSTTRYNWKNGHAWNTALDWYFENVNYTSDPDFGWSRFLDADRSRGLATALTVPIMGWVAKDTSSYSFPVSGYGPQQSTDPYKPDAGNGVSKDGRPLNASATSTSEQMPPEDIERWVRAIRELDQKRGSRSVWMYILDNEPMLWDSTHRDVHPDPAGYDEVLDKTLRYAAAVRRADPEAIIAGPALWGWPAYQWSAQDAKAGFMLRPDRRGHGDVPFLPWYLRKLAQHEKKTGERLLDVVDVHFYPMGQGIAGARGGTDPDTSARRIRATRALWDPSYVDESWIKEQVKLFPRLKEWIAKEYPGRGISVGEWNFGAEEHPSGGLAVAEALGRFGEYDLTSAFYWTYPVKNSHAFWAFRAYRNYDGHGAHFESFSLPARAATPLSAFASRDEEGDRITAVLLNFDSVRPLDVDVQLNGCGAVTGRRTFQHTPDARLSEVYSGEVEKGSLHQIVPPWSIVVVELALEAPAKKR